MPKRMPRRTPSVSSNSNLPRRSVAGDRETLDGSRPRADAGQFLRGERVGPPASNRGAHDPIGELTIGLDFENLRHAASVSSNRNSYLRY